MKLSAIWSPRIQIVREKEPQTKVPQIHSVVLLKKKKKKGQKK